MTGPTVPTPAAGLTETPDRHGAFPRLTPEQLDTLTRHGQRRRAQEGDVLFREGQRCEEFPAILSGLVEVVHDYDGMEQRATRPSCPPATSWSAAATVAPPVALPAPRPTAATPTT